MSSSSYPTFADELRTLKKRKRDDESNDGICKELINARNALCAECMKAALEDESEVSIEICQDPDYSDVDVCDFVDLTRKLGLKLKGSVGNDKWTVSWPEPPAQQQGFSFGKHK